MKAFFIFISYLFSLVLSEATEEQILTADTQASTNIKQAFAYTPIIGKSFNYSGYRSFNNYHNYGRSDSLIGRLIKSSNLIPGIVNGVIGGLTDHNAYD
ncbi:hypothetical protein K502DRAFT_349570 [Neoconidiobolus thromboides FSU 785]|nr:hypothetical protein K502DRAFT_349570 [Neoconidiobolus thromboides FSU 785]